MMRILVFTICARNYVGLARVLGRSLARHGAKVDFRIYVAEGDPAPGDRADPTIVSAPDALAAIIAPDDYANMAFMYNVTEFCTALKAACFKHGFRDGYDACLYMDPDIFLVADVDHIIAAFGDAAILLTPHLCLPAPGEGPRPDHGILATGIYNLGFLGLRRHPETARFLDWWDTRLRWQAFNDHYHSLYTDQRWMDFVPALFDREAVRIWRHLGCNVAPWNYHERRVIPDGDGYRVQPRAAAGDGAAHAGDPLVFLHFSGFDFRRILDGRFDQLNLADSETHGDLLPLYALYGEAIRAEAGEMKRHLEQPYGFEQFADGATILPSHRRLFRIWRERHGNAADPFAIGAGSFHAALAARNLLGGRGEGDLVTEKATARSVANPERLMGRARSVFRVMFRILGRTRFLFLMRSLNRFTRVEQQYDTFRLDDAAVTRHQASAG